MTKTAKGTPCGKSSRRARLPIVHPDTMAGLSPGSGTPAREELLKACRSALWCSLCRCLIWR